MRIRKFKCSNNDCNETFASQKGRNIHEQTCIMSSSQGDEEEEQEEQETDTAMRQVEVGTKRNGNDYESIIDLSKKARYEGTVKIRLLMVGRYAGALIGKGGQNFKRLREEYNVKITGFSTQAHYRVLCLEGERENCVSVIKEILPSSPEAPYASQTKTKIAFELNLLVNTLEVGSIIGKGGSKIKEICDKAGGKIKVYPDCLPNSNERVVSIGGEDEEQVINTLQIVLYLLESFQPKSATVFYDPANATSPVAAHGILGQGGLTNDHVSVAAILMYNRDTSDFGQVLTKTTLTVPNGMCGTVIGKGGQNLRQVRISSGAKIDINRTETGSDEDRIMTLTGTQCQIQIAQQLFSQLVRNSRQLLSAQNSLR